MAYAEHAGIPDRGLPLSGWPWRGIPGGEAAAVPEVAPTPGEPRRSAIPMEDGNYYILGPESCRLVIRSPRLVLRVSRTRDDDAAAMLVAGL
jgi:hypothetical protein